MAVKFNTKYFATLNRLPSIFKGALRKAAKNTSLRYLRQIAEIDQAKMLLTKTLSGVGPAAPPLREWPLIQAEPPYTELGKSSLSAMPSQRHDVVIITARFRTGSTLLWNIFRHFPTCTAYYEPLNERRWFSSHARGTLVDHTHRHVETYWQEYEHLEELEHFYHESWINQQLFMDRNTWAPDLKRYIELLIEKAPGRPVLQFNRIDFRLPWFRQHFPNAKIVHLYRHPRDQWCSTLFGSAFPPDGTMTEFAAHDHFYLRTWAQDLKYQFPFLDEHTVMHPYQLFYYLWKLSYWFGVTYAHHSLSFEAISTAPQASLSMLFQTLGIEHYTMNALQELIERPALDKWKAYADDHWFCHHERICETVLSDFFHN